MKPGRRRISIGPLWHGRCPPSPARRAVSHYHALGRGFGRALRCAAVSARCRPAPPAGRAARAGESLRRGR
jgi:hypothetical protein